MGNKGIQASICTVFPAPSLILSNFAYTEFYGGPLLTDITYSPWGGSFLYLRVIMDAYTKQVLSYRYK